MSTVKVSMPFSHLLDAGAHNLTCTAYAVGRKESEPSTEAEYVSQLSFTSNGNGTCSLSGLGTYRYAGEVVVPSKSPDGDTVKSLGSNALSGHTAMTSVVIPDTVTSIGEYGFSGCSSLTSIYLPASVQTFGNKSFYNTPSTKVIHYAGSLASWCSKSVYTASGNGAMGSPTYNYGWLSIDGEILTDIVIPDGVTSINAGVFAMNNMSSLEIPSSVSRIGTYAFYYCDNLTSVTIPATVTQVASAAFYSCGIKSLTIEGATTFDGSAFCWCDSLTNVTLCEGFTKISQQMFSECNALTKIHIPASVTSIGLDAFYSCDKLSTITYGGTMEQWKAISKGTKDDWAYETRVSRVTCTDGTVSI